MQVKTVTSAGFTGTQTGMTSGQKIVLKRILKQLDPDTVHHGDCIGADEQFHTIAKIIGIDVVIHPPDNDSKRAFCKYAYISKEPKPYLMRNKDIVDAGTVLLATPKSKREELRSGTWATIRYARKQGKKVIIIYPDGSIK